MILRDYQHAFVDNLAYKLRDHRKVVGQLATGGGKTVVFSAISSRFVAKAGKRVLILVHRKELLLQTRKTLYKAFGIDAQLIVAGMKYIPPAPVYLGMVESVKRRLHKLEDIGMVIIDEAHIAQFNKIHEHFPEAYIIGFTATPLSSSKRNPMKNHYDDIVCGVDIPELIATGALCQNITYAPKEVVDRHNLAVKNGEFDEHMMSNEFSKPKYIHNTVTAYQTWGAGTKAIVFNCTISHSREVANAFQEAGIDCKHLDSTMTSVERTRVLQWFSITPGAVLCNVGIATTGFDEPTIETVIVNKATMSMPHWLQTCGRGSRPTIAKSAFTIIDMGGNGLTHGDWSTSRDWYRLFYNPPKSSDDTGIAPVKECDGCSAIIPAAATKCPYCGYIYPAKEMAMEQQLSEFVVITKNIDVVQIMERNKNKKDYYPFFKIGDDLALHAFKTIPNLTIDCVNFILKTYDELAKTWCRELSKRRLEEWEMSPVNYDQPKKIIYNKWHQERAKEHLYNELKKLFPKWEPASVITTTLKG